MKKKYNQGSKSIGIICIILGIIFCVGTLFFHGKKLNGDFGISMAFLILMCANIGLACKKGINQLYEYTEELEKLVKTMNTKKLNEKFSVEDMQRILLTMGDEISVKEIKSAYQEFIRAYKKDTKQCRIEDYVNYEKLTEGLYMRYCDSLPGIMTSLGILGTFVSLILGLHNFNKVGDDMQGLIGSFISNVGVAFFTSIYGIVLSIFVNYVWSQIDERFENSVMEFQRLFSDAGLNCSENILWDSLYSETRAQTNEIKKLNEQFSKQLAEQLSKELVKPFEKTNLKISNLLENMQMVQNEAIKEMADKFVAEVNGIYELNNKRLEDTTSYLSQTVEKMCESSNAIKNEQDILFLQFERFVGEMKDIAGNMVTEVQNVGKQNENRENILRDMVDSLESVTLESENQVKILGSYQKSQEKQYELYEKIIERQENLLKSWDETFSRLDSYKYSMKAKENVQDEDALNKMQEEFNENMLRFDRYIQRRNGEIRDVFKEQTRKIVDCNGDFNEKLLEQMEEMNSKLSDLNTLLIAQRKEKFITRVIRKIRGN